MNPFAGSIRCESFHCRLPNGEEYRSVVRDDVTPAKNEIAGEATLYVMPFDISDDSDDRFAMPRKSTPRETHRRGVEEITRRLRAERENGTTPGKTVLSRVIVRDILSDNPTPIYRKLLDNNPDAFVFYLTTREAGIWLGASPELLCRKRGYKIETMALAGTRPSNDGRDWDDKNREEQKIVERFIRDVLSRYCDNVQCSEPYTRKAGYVEHICSDLTGELRNEADFGRLLKELSPTPALCGYPRNVAMEEIKRLEMWPRGLYGGYIALDYGNGEADIYVNLRSMRIECGKAAIYAGGGIMADSDPDSEWEETERKSLFLRTI